MSLADAPPRFIRKLPCLGEIWAFPIFVPLRFASSMSFPAGFCGDGFLKNEPEEKPGGCFCDFGGCSGVWSVGFSLNVADRTISFECLIRLSLYANFRSLFVVVVIFPVLGSRTCASVRIWAVTRSLRPAFPRTAPPTVPGSPIHFSRP